MGIQAHQIVGINITGACEEREIKKVGEDLVPGESTYHLVLRFPNGKVHLARVPEEAYWAYIAYVQKQMETSEDPLIAEAARKSAEVDKQYPFYPHPLTVK